LYEALGADPATRAEEYSSLFEGALGADTLKSIRDAVNGGAALGSPAFVTRMSRHAGRPMAVRQRGRPKTK
jgi:hypothetical protein